MFTVEGWFWFGCLGSTGSALSGTGTLIFVFKLAHSTKITPTANVPSDSVVAVVSSVVPVSTVDVTGTAPSLLVVTCSVDTTNGAHLVNAIGNPGFANKS
jgi:hypothetical protein